MKWGSFQISVVTFALVSVTHEIVMPERCLLAPETGHCRANIPMWFYNSTSNICEPFIYGGCPGTDNRFSTREECIQICQPENGVCSLSNMFQTTEQKPVNADYVEYDFFAYYCEKRCHDWCKASHAWGDCLSYSVERRWYGCYCYVFNRHTSNTEVDPTTQGQTWNRLCS